MFCSFTGVIWNPIVLSDGHNSTCLQFLFTHMSHKFETDSNQKSTRFKSENDTFNLLPHYDVFLSVISMVHGEWNAF